MPNEGILLRKLSLGLWGRCIDEAAGETDIPEKNVQTNMKDSEHC